MKTKIRTQVSNGSGPIANYKHMYIQVLIGRYGGDSDYLEVMGTITFQANIDEPDNWYGMTFKVETDRPAYIQKFGKLAAFVMKQRKDYTDQPDDIKRIIGAEEHFYYDSIGFIPESAQGLNLYKVIAQGGTYCKVFADTETKAMKKVAKKNIAGASIEFDKVIVF
jgi:mRNA-degrading endonuclease HigB of HigAB toxin-antitoxin module